MDTGEREELERGIRRRVELGDLAGAATVALEGYGPELFGYLVTLQRDQQAAEEVFSDTTERIWKGLPGFGWQCSFRTWAYTVARHASHSRHRAAQRRGRRLEPLPEGSALSAIGEAMRSATKNYLKTETKDRFAALRESLPAEDQELLVLRVDKRLAWNDLAQVFHDGADTLDAPGIKREAARLRKRFQLIKERIVELGRREGLVGESEEPA